MSNDDIGKRLDEIEWRIIRNDAWLTGMVFLILSRVTTGGWHVAWCVLAAVCLLAWLLGGLLR